MRTFKIGICLAALVGAAGLATSSFGQTAAGSAFTYQGHLDDNGVPANGTYDLQFQLAPALTGSFAGGSQIVEDVVVVNGLFTAKINFGWNAFQGDARFIEVRVRPGASVGTFTPLAPRQELTPAPYALGLALPMTETQSSASSLLSFDQNGTGNAMTLSSTNGDCLNLTTDGTGDALYAHTTAVGGNAVTATTSGANAATYAVYAQGSNGSTPLFAYNLGPSSYTGLFRAENSANDSTCVEVQQNGTGVGLHVNARADRAGFFENTNASNSNITMLAQTNSAGTAVYGWANGTGTAGRFLVNNAASNAPAVWGSTNGTGPAGRFEGRVDVTGPVNATTGGVMNRISPIAFARMNSAGTLLASSGNVQSSWVNGVGIHVQITGEANAANWIIIPTVQLGSNVPGDHSFEARCSYQAADGSFNITSSCTNCDGFFNDNTTISFVIYQGQ